eukprot:jgi/Botrbrau1/4223/Bobra.0044s0020.1
MSSRSIAIMGKKRWQKEAYTGGHKIGPAVGPEAFLIGEGPVLHGGLDIHELYEQAVQSPQGEVDALLKFFRQYVGPQVAEHLREDFCGTALVAATWCKRDVRRTATAIDNDPGVLQWGLAHNILAHDLTQRVCLLENNVLAPDAEAKFVDASIGGQHQAAGGPLPDSLHHLAAIKFASPVASGADLEGTLQGATAGAAGSRSHSISATRAGELPHDRCISELGLDRDGKEVEGQVVPEPLHQERPGQSFLRAPDVSTYDGKHRNTCSADFGDHVEPMIEHYCQASQTVEGSEGEHAEAVSAEADLPGVHLLAAKPCDVVCALNYCICLLHTVHDLRHYLKKARAAIGTGGGIFVADLLGGSSAEASTNVVRRNQVTGAEYQWEQTGFDPVTRRLHAYLSLRHRTSRRTVRRAFHYHWRLWTLPEVRDLLLSAGFADVKVWLRPLEVATSASPSEEPNSGATESLSYGFVEYTPGRDMQCYEGGWSAYVIGVVSN